MENYREPAAPLPPGLPSCLREPAPRDAAAVSAYVSRARRGVYLRVGLVVFGFCAALTAFFVWTLSRDGKGYGFLLVPAGMTALLAAMLGSVAAQARATVVRVLCAGEVLPARVASRVARGRTEHAWIEARRADGTLVRGALPLPAWAPGGLAEGSEGVAVFANAELVFLARVADGEPIPYPGTGTAS